MFRTQRKRVIKKGQEPFTVSSVKDLKKVESLYNNF